MQEYSRPLGDTVRSARIRQGYTQKQVSDILDIDERSIASIEKYQANTTMDILYPLIRLLKIDAREIFNPEMSRESQTHYQLNTPGWNRQFDRARPTPLPLKSYTLSASPTPSV